MGDQSKRIVAHLYTALIVIVNFISDGFLTTEGKVVIHSTEALH